MVRNYGQIITGPFDHSSHNLTAVQAFNINQPSIAEETYVQLLLVRCHINPYCRKTENLLCWEELLLKKKNNYILSFW